MPNNPNAVDNLVPFTGADDPRRSPKPKGAIHLSTRIQNMLNDDNFTVEEVVDGKRVQFKGNPAQAIIKTAILKAKGGDKQWADWLAQHGYGSKLVIETADPVEETLKKLGLIDGSTGKDQATPSETS